MKKIPAQEIYLGEYDGHSGRFHFSFADYEDPENGPFGVLEALNDFEVDPGSGFDTHPHEEMEIISYCIDGTLAHVDNMGHRNTIGRGDVQYLCAGSGITHSEMNATVEGPLRFLQIWITPDKKGLSPFYLSKEFSKNVLKNELRLVVSGEALDSVITIQQDANIYVAELEKDKQLTIANREKRQSYLFCIEGSLASDGFNLSMYDAVKLRGEERLTLTALEKSHLLMVEMAEEN